MKRLKYIYIFILIFLPIASFAVDLKVKYVHGVVEFRKSNDIEYKKLKKGETIGTGDIIRTGSGSFLELEIPGSGFIRLVSDTTVIFSRLESSELSVQLDGGYLLTRFNSTPDIQSLTVTTATARAIFKDSIGKVYASNFSTTVICVKGVIETGSNMPEWQHIETKKIGTTDKITLTNLINQTNAPIIPATEDELYIDTSLFEQQSVVQEEEVRLQDFRREAEIARKIKDRTAETGFRFNMAFGGYQKHHKGYFLFSFRPEFFYRNFSITLDLPLYLDGYNRFYNSSHWGNKDEYNFTSTKDTLHDLLIKIEQIHIGKKGTEYFVLLGRLEPFSWGNGFLVNRINNVEGYPTIKRNGFYFETDFKFIGVQGFIADINIADVQGYRIFTRPLYKTDGVMKDFEFGITGVFDVNPTLSQRNNPMIFNLSYDFKIPVYSKDNVKISLVLDATMQGFKFKDAAAAALYTLPSHYDKGYAGVNYLKGVIYHVAGKLEFHSLLNVSAGFFHCTQGMSPMMFDTFYLSMRKERSETLLRKDMEDPNVGGHIDVKFIIKKTFYIEVSYFFMKGNPVRGYEDRFHLGMGLIPGALWKLHFNVSYDKTDFFKTPSSKVFNRVLLTIELGVIWTQNVSVMATVKRYFDETGTDYRLFLFETRLTF